MSREGIEMIIKIIIIDYGDNAANSIRNLKESYIHSNAILKITVNFIRKV